MRALLQRVGEIRFRHLQRSHDPEQETRQKRQAGGRNEHAQIQGDGRDARHAFGHRGAEDLNRPHGDDNGEHGADGGQCKALNHQLANEPPATAAERGPNRHLPLARAGADEQKIGDVGAGDQQDDRHGTKQHQHPRLRARTDEMVVQ